MFASKQHKPDKADASNTSAQEKAESNQSDLNSSNDYSLLDAFPNGVFGDRNIVDNAFTRLRGRTINPDDFPNGMLGDEIIEKEEKEELNSEELQLVEQEKLKDEFDIYAAHKIELINQGADIGFDNEKKPQSKEEKENKFKTKSDSFQKKMNGSRKNFWGTKRYYRLLEKWFPDYELVISNKVSTVKNTIHETITTINANISNIIETLKEAIDVADRDIGKALKLITTAQEYIDDASAHKDNAVVTLAGFKENKKQDFLAQYDEVLSMYQELVLNLQTTIQAIAQDKTKFETTITQLADQQTSLIAFNLKIENTSGVIELVELLNTEFIELINSAEKIIADAKNVERTTVGVDEAEVQNRFESGAIAITNLDTGLEELTGGVSTVYWGKGIYYGEEVDALYIVAKDYASASKYTRTVKYDDFWFFVDKETGWISGIQQRDAVKKYYLFNPITRSDMFYFMSYLNYHEISISKYKFPFSIDLLNELFTNEAESFRKLVEQAQLKLYGTTKNNGYGLLTPETKEKIKKEGLYNEQELLPIKENTLPSFLNEDDKDFVIGNKGKSVGDVGVISEDGYKVKYVPRPRINSLGMEGYKFELSINTRVLVLREYDGWYFISSLDGKNGWIEHHALAFNPPEPNAELYKVNEGDTLWSVAKKKYQLDKETDKRLYINAIIYANYKANRQKNITNTKTPGMFELGDPYHYNPHIKAGTGIWIPSKKFVQMLKDAGLISDGSLKNAFWDALAKAWDSVVEFFVSAWEVIKGVAGFIAGLVWGFVESIVDLFVGIYEVVEGFVKVIISAITGELYKKGKELYHQIKNMTSQDWLDLLEEIGKGIDSWMSDFDKQWNAEDVFDRWFFRGRVVGYVIGEIVMAIFTAGIATGVKWGAKFLKYFGKVGKKIVDIIEGITKKYKKVTTKKKLNFDPKSATAKQKGNFGEIVSDTHLKEKHNMKRIGDDPPKTIDDPLRKGIDGIYENSSPPPKYVINESKYGQGKLNPKTADGPQMSDKWVRERLESEVGKQKADDIIQSMKNGDVDKILSKVDESGNVTTFKLDKDGKKIGVWP